MTFSPGGGAGAGSVGGSSDVSLSNPTEGHTLVYSDGTGKWQNEDLFSLRSNTQTGSYTLALSDKGRVIEINSASSSNITVPADSAVDFPLNSVVEIYRHGTGEIAVVGASGVTIRSSGGRTKLAEQYSSAVLRKRGANEWVLAGDLTT